MKQQLLLISAILLSTICYSQINFEKGYFITNDNERVECFIKNVDWKDNPTGFEYKLAEGSEPHDVSIVKVKEFGVGELLKYKRALVKIDRSVKNISTLKENRDPEFNEETLFLQQLIQGKANLYTYTESNLNRYFFNVDSTEIEQLVFKTYLDNKIYIKENNTYKQQLREHLKCKNIDIDEILKIRYTKSDLVGIFIKYNKCAKSDLVNYAEPTKRKSTNVSIKPGFGFSSLSIQNSSSSIKYIDFGSNQNFRFGVELEYILPYNKNRWIIFIEPTYQYFKAEREITYTQVYSIIKKTNVEVDYKSIEVPVGVRHNFFLSERSRLFINGAFVLDFNLNSSITAERKDLMDLEISSRPNFILGLGYGYNDRYSIELRVGSNREILGEHISWHSDYSAYSIIFGLRIF
ncbi:MAG: PorT family protein [Bacteroidales bacterium]|nr:PorT family protein [Bacteroidales bacterium]MCF8454808.1 PorT family protein [Bacteroidales bacterium]